MMTTPTSTTTTVRAPWLIPGALVAAAGGALVLALCNLLVGITPGRTAVASTADQVRLVGAHPVLTEWIIATGVLAAVLLVPGIWAVAARLAPRSRWLSTIGGWAMASGYVCSLALTTDTMYSLAVAQGGLDPEAYGAAVDGSSSIWSVVVFGVFGIGGLAGAVILGIAILRQGGAVPAWLEWLLIAAEPVRIAGLASGLVQIGPPLASVFIAVAFAGVIMATRRPRAPGALGTAPA